MKQFYRLEAPAGSTGVLHFDAPVRKMLVVVSRGVYISVPYSDNTFSVRFYIPPNMPVAVDLQSANGGKGCASLGVGSISSDTPANCYISIVEYGSDGDNDWYK